MSGVIKLAWLLASMADAGSIAAGLECSAAHAWRPCFECWRCAANKGPPAAARCSGCLPPALPMQQEAAAAMAAQQAADDAAQQRVTSKAAKRARQKAAKVARQGSQERPEGGGGGAPSGTELPATPELGEDRAGLAAAAPPPVLALPVAATLSTGGGGPDSAPNPSAAASPAAASACVSCGEEVDEEFQVRGAGAAFPRKVERHAWL